MVSKTLALSGVLFMLLLAGCSNKATSPNAIDQNSGQTGGKAEIYSVKGVFDRTDAGCFFLKSYQDSLFELSFTITKAPEIKEGTPVEVSGFIDNPNFRDGYCNFEGPDIIVESVRILETPSVVAPSTFTPFQQ